MTKQMIYNIKIQFNRDYLIEAYCDNQGISIRDFDLDLESILEQELTGWLENSAIQVKQVEEVKE